MISSVSRPVRIERVQILTGRTAVVESHAGSDGQPVANRDRVGREHRGCQQHAADVGRKARDALQRLPAPVLEPDAGRNHVDRVVLAAFELSADLPLVLAARGHAGNG